MIIHRPASAALPSRKPFPLIFAICVSAFLPYLVRVLALPEQAPMALHNQALIANIAAVLIGTWILRNVGTYPGVESTGYTLPAFASSYGIILALLIVGRFEYNRVILITGFILSVITFYVALFRKNDSMRYVVAYTPFADLGELRANNRITWIPFNNPEELPEPAHAVVTDLRSDVPDSWDRALAELALRGVPVYHIKHLRESITGKVDLEHMSETNFGSLSPVSAYMSVKRVVDMIGALVILPLVFPLLLMCAVAIKLSSPGPIFFRQQRIGYRGQPFLVFKLRTMTHAVVDSQKRREEAMTQDNDQRITRIGRFLRTTRIDELPQLLNVLRGEMSWIGPRPEAEVLSKWYENEIAFYMYRHIVKPGITGWAQVNQGHVANVDDVREKLHYDFFYIKNFSFWIDALIVLRTVRTMITGNGAK